MSTCSCAYVLTLTKEPEYFLFNTDVVQPCVSNYHVCICTRGLMMECRSNQHDCVCYASSRECKSYKHACCCKTKGPIQCRGSMGLHSCVCLTLGPVICFYYLGHRGYLLFVHECLCWDMTKTVPKAKDGAYTPDRTITGLLEDIKYSQELTDWRISAIKAETGGSTHYTSFRGSNQPSDRVHLSVTCTRICLSTVIPYGVSVATQNRDTVKHDHSCRTVRDGNNPNAPFLLHDAIDRHVVSLECMVITMPDVYRLVLTNRLISYAVGASLNFKFRSSLQNYQPPKKCRRLSSTKKSANACATKI